jgi:hypothetical protein
VRHYLSKGAVNTVDTLFPASLVERDDFQVTARLPTLVILGGQHVHLRIMVRLSHASASFLTPMLRRRPTQVAFPRFSSVKPDLEKRLAMTEAVLLKPRDMREHDDLHVLLAWTESVPFLRQAPGLATVEID